jgi:MFS family permease
MASASVSTANIESAPAQHPLRNRNVQLLLTGNTISFLGDECYLVALPWLVLQMTGSAVAMGTILMAAAIPRLLFMLAGGAVTDRVSPRKIMITTASARTIVVALIAALVWYHVLRMWELYALSFAFGVTDAFAAPASGAYLPSLVKREQLPAANSLFQSTAQLTTIAGPAPAGLLIRACGLAWAFIVDAISFLFIIAAMWILPDPPPAASPARKAFWPSIREGIAYVAKDVPLRTLLLVAAVMNFCVSGASTVGLAYLAKTKLGSPTSYGTTISTMAAGALIGSLLAGIWHIHRRGVAILLACGSIGVSMATLGFLESLWSIAVALVIQGVAAGLANVHTIAWIQQRIEPAMRGRVMSVVILAVHGLLPASLAAAGILIAWSLKWMFVVSGLAMAITAAGAALQKPVREIR